MAVATVAAAVHSTDDDAIYLNGAQFSEFSARNTKINWSTKSGQHTHSTDDTLKVKVQAKLTKNYQNKNINLIN